MLEEGGPTLRTLGGQLFTVKQSRQICNLEFAVCNLKLSDTLVHRDR